ncbi:MAG: L-threonylcarbamoyladenylate synthase [Lentisphaeria bacterium]
MVIYTLDQENDEELARIASEALLCGEVVLLPTETVYGLMSIYGNEEAKEKIIKIKNRPKEKQFQLLVDSIENIHKMGIKLSKVASKLCDKFWPGAMTLVVDHDGETVGLRMPDHELVRKIIRLCGMPLVATSANLSGEPPLNELAFLDNYFKVEKPYLAVESDLDPQGKSSTVVQVCGEEVVILREGAIRSEEIYKAIEMV